MTREVIDRLIEHLGDGPSPDLADLYAEDAVIEVPLRGEHPQGREGYRAHLAEAAEVQRFDSVDVLGMYQTDDPEVLVYELRLHGHVLATGEPLELTTITVTRVRDGLITWCRSYSGVPA